MSKTLRGATSVAGGGEVRDARPSAWRGASLIAIAFLLFGGTIGGEYVFDGVKLVRDNPLLTPFEPLRIARMDWWAGSGEPGGLYRPVSLVWLAGLRALAGSAPFLINFANVALHGLVAWLHFALLWRLLAGRPGAAAIAWIAALIALVHPLGVEVVCGQVGAADLLANLFLIGAVLVARGTSAWRFLLGAALAALAVLSKESGVAVIPLAVLFEALRVEADGAWKRRAARALAWSMLGVGLALVCRYAAIGSLTRVDDPVFAGFSWLARAASACAAFASYSLPLLVAPWRQIAVVSHLDVLPASGFGDPRAIAGVLAILALSIAPVFALRRGRRDIAFGCWFFLAAWLPTSNLFFSTGAIAASRFLYAGSIGLCLPLAWLLFEAWSRSKAARVLAVVLASWFIVAFGVVTFRESSSWRSERELLEAQVERAPASVYPLIDQASALSASDPARAKQLFARAAESQLPRIPGTEFPPEDLLESVYLARTGLAQLESKSSDPLAAEASYRTAEELAERGREARKTLPFRGDWNRHRVFALQHLAASALERAKTATDATLAVILAEAQRALDACDLCDPESSESVRLRSILMQRRGDPLGRRRVIEEAWLARPSDPLLRILWANELRQVGRTEEGLALEVDVATEVFDDFDRRRSLAIAKEGLSSKNPATVAKARALLERLASLRGADPETRAIAKQAATYGVR
ncbi:MAG TPA: hypothetical protein VK843_04760 [Planctomycetota bacterium]|nr:hypothetical protein [Planctomycetota bacterium]